MKRFHQELSINVVIDKGILKNNLIKPFLLFYTLTHIKRVCDHLKKGVVFKGFPENFT